MFHNTATHGHLGGTWRFAGQIARAIEHLCCVR